MLLVVVIITRASPSILTRPGIGRTSAATTWIWGARAWLWARVAITAAWWRWAPTEHLFALLSLSTPSWLLLSGLKISSIVVSYAFLLQIPSYLWLHHLQSRVNSRLKRLASIWFNSKSEFLTIHVSLPELIPSTTHSSVLSSAPPPRGSYMDSQSRSRALYCKVIVIAFILPWRIISLR